MPEEPRNNTDYDGLSTPRPEPMPEPEPGRWCLLRHDLPDGSWHLDLLIAPGPESEPEPDFDPARPLFTLRLPGQTLPLPNHPDCQGFQAERIADHRAVYLDYEGPVSGGRGRVTRLASGTAGEFSTGDGGRDGSEDGPFEVELEGARYRSAGDGPLGLIRFERAR
ncbi:MAG: hypothetical protein ACI89L_000054 [Phycisphaerales bacterium]|jgi:hypothetical protein